MAALVGSINLERPTSQTDRQRTAMTHTPSTPSAARIDVAIVIPAYNEAVAIAETIRDYKTHFPGARIIVVDNNSTDATFDQAAAATDPSRDFVLREPRQGKGYAVKRGISRSTANVFIITDGDLTYPASDARRLFDLMCDERMDMVVGDRVSGGQYAKQNKRAGHSLGDRLLTWTISTLCNRRFNDVLSGLRVMSSPFVSMLDVRSSGFQLETEINVTAAYLKADVVEERIDYLEREEGSSSKLDTIQDGIRILSFAILQWMALRPLQFFSIAAALVFVMSLSLAAFVLGEFAAAGFTAMEHPSTAVAAATLAIIGTLAFFTGVILTIIGQNQQRRDIASLLSRRRAWNAALDARSAKKVVDPSVRS